MNIIRTPPQLFQMTGLRFSELQSWRNKELFCLWTKAPKSNNSILRGSSMHSPSSGVVLWVSVCSDHAAKNSGVTRFEPEGLSNVMSADSHRNNMEHVESSRLSLYCNIKKTIKWYSTVYELERRNNSKQNLIRRFLLFTMTYSTFFLVIQPNKLCHVRSCTLSHMTLFL